MLKRSAPNHCYLTNFMWVFFFFFLAAHDDVSIVANMENPISTTAKKKRESL